MINFTLRLSLMALFTATAVTALKFMDMDADNMKYVLLISGFLLGALSTCK